MGFPLKIGIQPWVKITHLCLETMRSSLASAGRFHCRSNNKTKKKVGRFVHIHMYNIYVCVRVYIIKYTLTTINTSRCVHKCVYIIYHIIYIYIRLILLIYIKWDTSHIHSVNMCQWSKSSRWSPGWLGAKWRSLAHRAKMVIQRGPQWKSNGKSLV